MNLERESTSIDIPIGGTLGLLAYGYKGIMLWRGERKKAEQKLVSQIKESTQSQNLLARSKQNNDKK